MTLPASAAPQRADPRAASAAATARSDIQALRALAVGSVLLYHLWPGRFTGGYIGVDVFFAISGYLITGHLLAEIDATGRLRPARFWARRAKRLLPAATLTLLVTTLAIVVWVPRFLWHQFLNEVSASTLQFENWLLAHNAVDYLAANNAASPTQHFWTLGVEEQFYVGLPLLLLLVIGLARVVRAPVRRLAVAVLATIVVASLAYSIHLTATTPGVAYFSTFTRAWEFACGALLAGLSPSARGSADRMRRTSSGRHHAADPTGGSATKVISEVVTGLALVAIVAACFNYGAKTPFPGIAAAVPVLGAVAVIAAGQRSFFARLGRFGPVALLGRVSYAAYLWHWPMIVILLYATGRPLGTSEKLGVIVATILVAWLSTTFVEDPIRFGPRLLGQRRQRIVAAWGALAMCVVLTVSLTVRHVQNDQVRHLASRTHAVVSDMPKCIGAQAMDPRLAPCDNPALNGVLVPDPDQAAKDVGNEAACWGFNPGGTPKLCRLGPTTGARKRLLAAGDSHSNALIGVYKKIATANDWEVDVAGTGGCYLTTAKQEQPSNAEEAACERWRADVIQDASKGHYDAIIVTHSDNDRKVIPPPGQTLEQATVNGLVQAWQKLPDVPIIAIRDNPAMPPLEMTCVVDHRDTAQQTCAIPKQRALGFDGQAQAAERVSRATVIDLTSFYCTTVCPPVIGHVLVYGDPTHLTATYAATLFPYIDTPIRAALSLTLTPARRGPKSPLAVQSAAVSRVPRAAGLCDTCRSEW